MSVKPVPEGYYTVTPYLINSSLRPVIEFAEKTFGAKLIDRFDTPDGKIAHAVIQVGDSRIMMGEASGDFPEMPAMLHLYVDDVDATYKRAIEAGAESVREPSTEFYGDRSSGVKDSQGNMWWIATHVEDVSPEQMEERMKAYKETSQA